MCESHFPSPLFPSADAEWLGLVNAMSGLLCTHLSSIDPTSTYQPLYSFKPQGAIIGTQQELTRLRGISPWKDRVIIFMRDLRLIHNVNSNIECVACDVIDVLYLQMRNSYRVLVKSIRESHSSLSISASLPQKAQAVRQT